MRIRSVLAATVLAATAVLPSRPLSEPTTSQASNAPAHQQTPSER